METFDLTKKTQIYNPFVFGFHDTGSECRGGRVGVVETGRKGGR